MKYFVILFGFMTVIGFAGTVFAVPEPLPEDDFRYSDHVVTGKIISSEIIIDPREDNSAATFYDTIIYKVKVEKWHKNPLADYIITVYGTHFPNDVIPEPNWGVLEFEIGDTVYLYIDKTDEGLKFREYGSKLLYSRDSGKTEITLSPLKQFKAGIPIDQIQCKENLERIQKHDDIPACVKSSSMWFLTERDWMKLVTFETISGFPRHEIENGQIISMKLVKDESCFPYIIITIDSKDSGSLEIFVSRTILDPKINGQDDSLLVLSDGIEVAYDERDNSIEYRILNIPFEKGTKSIEIIATCLI